MKYREKFHLSQQEFDNTDLSHILRDMQMMSTEAEALDQKQKENSQKP